MSFFFVTHPLPIPTRSSLSTSGKCSIRCTEQSPSSLSHHSNSKSNLVFPSSSPSVNVSQHKEKQQKQKSEDITNSPLSSKNHSLPSLNVSRRSILSAASALTVSSLIPSSSLTSNATPTPPSKLSTSQIDYLFDAQSGSFVPPSGLFSLLRRDAQSNLLDRCIIAAEIHDNKPTHDAQLAIIDSARRLGENDGRSLMVGFEQFYRPHDKYLSDYIDRKITLDDLLELTDWNNTWGFDVKLYQPIFEYCRDYGIIMKGLNVPAILAHTVAQYGIEALPDKIKMILPNNMDFNNQQHYQHFMNLMKSSHHFSHTDTTTEMDDQVKKILNNYYQVQVLWEEWMSQSAALSLSQKPNSRLVTLIGSGHVEARTGYPDRLEKRINERPYTIVPKPVSWKNNDGYITPNITKPDRDIADLVWYTKKA